MTPSQPQPFPVALVTGGAQGIGKGLVKHLLSEGWGVAIADRDPAAGAETAEEFEALGAVVSIQADVSQEDSVAAMVEKTLARFGRLDGLVNNAGLTQADWGPLEHLSLADWNRVIGINLTGAFLCAKHSVPALRQARGAILNIASTRALMSEPNSEAYAASKGGILALTHALAISLGPEIRSNCISPGWIEVSDWKTSTARKPPSLRPKDHSQHPAGRVGTPQDIAELAAFLLSNRSGFITGQNFVVDGGMTRKMAYLE